MQDANRGFGLVHMLTTGAARFLGGDLEICKIDDDVGFFGFGQYRDRCG